MGDELQKNSYNYQNSRLFHATVRSCDPATMVMELSPDGHQEMAVVHGLPLSHAFASAMGFKETMLYPVGSRVLCQSMGGHHALILGSMPLMEQQGDAIANLPTKIALSADEPIFHQVHHNGYLEDLTKLNVINNGLPTDVVQGEKVIANEFGVMLALFQMVATLRASDLAQVQCHFLDDLVRIVSHNFQHYTALGELNIYHDGPTINMEQGATHNPFESIGMVDPNVAASIPSITAVDPANPDTSGTKTANDFFQITKNARALERLKLFVGKLGGFVNLLLCYPSGDSPYNAKDGTINTNATPDAGLLQIKANLDGSLVVRSANGIYLEKTDWIRVPQRVLAPDDPAGDDNNTVNYPRSDAYQFSNNFVSDYNGVAFLYYLQLRDYLAYTNEELGYKDFKTLGKDFHVNGDYHKNSLPQGVNTYIDPYSGVTYQRTRAIVALMPNGGIALADNWGSCISMEGGNIYIQPANDLVLQPGRNIIAKVGGQVSLAVNKDIDISSTVGSMRVKTAGAQQFYSDHSGILLQANGQPTSPSIQTFSKDFKSVIGVSGIVLYAPNSAIAGSAGQVYIDAADSMLLSSTLVTLQSDEWLRLFGDNTISINCAYLESTTTGTTVFYSQEDFVAFGDGDTLLGTLQQTIVEPFQGTGLIDYTKSPDKAFRDSIRQAQTNANEFKPSNVIDVFTDKTGFSGIQFQFLPSLAYNITATDAIIPQTYSQQQFITLGAGTDSWAEVPVNGSYPYPGTEFAANSYASLTPQNVQNINNRLVNKTTDLLNIASTIQTSNVFTSYPL